MWANRYFGPRYWGDRYWGDGGEIIVEPPTPEEVGPGRGMANWDRFARQGKGKPRIIRFSDYESREEYARALAAAALPLVPIPLETTLDEWEEIEDEFIAFELMRLLH